MKDKRKSILISVVLLAAFAVVATIMLGQRTQSGSELYQLISSY